MRGPTLSPTLLCAAVAIFLAGCSQPESSAEAGGNGVEIELLLGDVSMNKLPFIMAFEEGVYAQNGLKVTPKFTPGAVDIIRGSGVEVPDDYIAAPDVTPLVKIGGASPHLTRMVMREGAWDPIVLGSTHTVSRWRIVGRPELSGPEDLKGRRIGYSGVGAVTHFMAVSFAEHMGWDPESDWTMVGGALAVEALDVGDVDAIVGPELHATMAIDAGYRVLVDLGDYAWPVAGSSFLFDRVWLAENQDAARRLIKSYVEALALLKTDKNAAFRTLRKWYRIADDALLELFYAEAEKLPSKPYPPYEGLKRMMEIYDSSEMRKYSPEYFYDDTFVRDLDQSGFIDSLYR